MPQTSAPVPHTSAPSAPKKCPKCPSAPKVKQGCLECARCVERCLFCTSNLNDGQDHTKCTILSYECSTCQQSFTSSGKRRTHQCGGSQLATSGVEGYFRVYKLVIPSLPSQDFFNILIDSKARIASLLRWLLDEFGAMKFYISIEMSFIEVIGDKTHAQHFTTSATVLLESSIMQKVVTKHLLKLIERVDGFISLGSGCIILSLNSVKLNVTPYNVSTAGSYIETPKELEFKWRCLLNI